MAFAGRLDAASIGALWRTGDAGGGAGARPGAGVRPGRACRSATWAARASWPRSRRRTAKRRSWSGRRSAWRRCCSGRAQATRARAARRDRPADHRAGRHRAALGLLAASVAFIGEAAVAIVRLPARRRMLRVPDLLRYVDQAGVRSLPLVAAAGLSDRPDPGVPVGGADAAVRRRHLRRQPGRDQPGARTWSAAGGGDPGRTHRLRLRRRDRHHEGERGDRCPDDDGARSDDHAGAAAHHRGDAGDAGHDPGARHRRHARHDHGDARLRLSARDDRAAGAELGRRRRPVWRAVQGDVLRHRGRGDRLPRRPGHRRRARAPSVCRPPRRWSAALLPRSRSMACSP